MTREIKFRGKRISDADWFYGNLITEIDGDRNVTNAYIHIRLSKVEFTEDSIMSRMCLHKVVFETVGQYTGLKDKNGKEIYEGDILNHRTYVRNNVIRQGVVCFDEKQCTYKLVPHEAHESNAGNGGWSGFAFDYHICLEAEIIGNIYENPELLAVMDT